MKFRMSFHTLSALRPETIFSTYEQVNLVGNTRTSAQKALDVVNPATGAVIGHAAASTAPETDAAVACAKTAQVAWALMPARDRGKAVAAAARSVAAQA